MRRGFIGGNWKMHGHRAELAHLVEKMQDLGVDKLESLDIAVFPSFVYLSVIHAYLHGGRVALGAQNQAEHEQGAFTGEVSPAMLKDVGCKYVLLGHSERRHLYGESSEVVARKLMLAKENQLLPVLCVGETEAERSAGMTEEVISKQLAAVFDLGGAEVMTNVIIAYEPVWAIGTGHVATAEQAQAVHAFIRQSLVDRDAALAEKTRIIYGGSLKPENAAAIFAMPDVDGGLIGGASLKAEEFVGICRVGAAEKNK